MAGKKKKGKRRPRRIVDSEKQLTEEPGSGIEPGQALDEAESVEGPAKVKKAVKAAPPEKKIDKTARKPGTKGPGVWAKTKRFFKDVHAEAKKVVWPDPEQQKNSTIVVVITIVALAAFMGFFSKIFYNISDLLFMPQVSETGAIAQEQPGFETVPGEGEEDEGGGIGDGVPDEAEGTSQIPTPMPDEGG